MGTTAVHHLFLSLAGGFVDAPQDYARCRNACQTADEKHCGNGHSSFSFRIRFGFGSHSHATAASRFRPEALHNETRREYGECRLEVSEHGKFLR
jgi:hypothetical protein